MKHLDPFQSNRRRLTLACALAGLLVIALWCMPVTTLAQEAAGATNTAVTAAASTNAPGATNAIALGAAGATNNPASTNTDIQLSFQGANVDMIVKWLAEQTGKSVLKHPRVQCQLNITSSKKISPREAIMLVYRALALEGVSAIESPNSILLVPQDQEPKMSPLLLDASQNVIPEGRQKIVKIFPLEHMQAADMRDKIRGAISDKGAIDLNESANQLIVTDYTENLRLLAEMIKELDVSDAQWILQTYPIRHGDTDEVGNLLNMILGAQLGGGGSGGGAAARPARPSTPSSSGGSPMPMGMPGSDSSGSASGGASAAPVQQIRIWPDKSASRLIVGAPKGKHADVQRLINILDADKAPDVTARMIPLKNLSAVDLVREVGPLYQRMGSRSPKDLTEISANDRANALIVYSSEANFKSLEKLITTLDTEEAQEKVTKTFTLKNAEAEDIARQVQELNQEGSSSRYTIVYYDSRSSGGGRAKQIKVVADRRRNSVIVQAAPSQMESIEKMITELDAPVSDDSLAPKIYPLKYVNAADIEDVLNELFLKKQQQQRSYYDYIYDLESGQSSSSGQDAGRLFGKVRVTSEPYSNSLIISANSKEAMEAVEEVIKQLDRPSEAGESTLRIGLKFAKASTVANSINLLFARQGSPQMGGRGQQGQPQGGQNNQQQQQQRNNNVTQTGFTLEQESKEEGYYPWLGGQPDAPGRGQDGRPSVRPVSDLVGRVRAVADQRANAVLVSANVHLLPQVLKLIDDLDASTDQVLIEARLVEVSSDFFDKLGVRWSPDGTAVFTGDDFDNSFMAGAGSRYQKGFNGRDNVNTPSGLNNGNVNNVSPGNLAQTLVSLRQGVLDSTISMDFLVQFLRKTTDASVLAAPQINVRDNETGRLFVGQEVPIPDNNQVFQQGGQNTSITYKKVGVVLEVTPHINSSGDVELKIHAESSTVVPGQTVLGGALFDTRSFQTDLRAKSGQTLVLGGIIQKQISDTLRKTPVLGSIPGVGWAFKKKDKTSHNVELMVFLRPKVVRTVQDGRQLLEDLDRRAPLIKKWKDEMQLEDRVKEPESEDLQKAAESDGFPKDPGRSPAVPGAPEKL